MVKKLSLLIFSLIFVFANNACVNGPPVNTLQACRVSITMVMDKEGMNNYAAMVTWHAIGKYLGDNLIDLDCANHIVIENEERYTEVSRSLLFENRDLLIFADSDFAESLTEVASLNINQKFISVDFAIDKSNVLNIEFSKKEAAYLLGLAAALKAKDDNRDGFVFVNEKDNDKYISEWQGYQAGIKEIMPNADISIIELETDKEHLTELKKVFEEEIFSLGKFAVYDPVLSSNEELYKLALEKEKEGRIIWILGHDPSNYDKGLYNGKDSLVLTSVQRDYDIAIKTAIDSYLDETFIGGVINTAKFSLLNDGLSLVLISERNLSESQILTLKSYIDRVKSGDLIIQ